MSTTFSTALEEALRLAGQGFAVLPLHTPVDGVCDCRVGGCKTSPGKHPRTMHGVDDATSEVTKIRHWWSLWPQANAGVRLGDDMVLIDVDGADALERLRRLVSDAELMPRSPTVVTGRGWHVYVKAPPGARTFNPVDGVDVKVGNSFGVVPPSIHVSGATYRYAPDRILGELPLAECPSWLLAMFQDRPKRKVRQRPDEPIPEGRRHNTLVAIAGSMRRQGAAEAEIRAALTAANARCRPPLGQDELDSIVRSMGGKEPEPDPLLVLDGTRSAKRKLLTVNAALVEPESVSWLWDGRVPLGKMTIIEGDPGLAKSTITLDLAARVTTGRAMPDGTPGIGPGAAIVASVEDGAADTIVPRLTAAGADLALVDIILGAGSEADPGMVTLPADVQLIERRISETGARLVVVDPLAAFFSESLDTHKDHHVRRGLGPLAAVAERTGAAVIVIRHLSKGSGGSAIYRGTGSIGIIGAARSAMLVAVNPDDDERVLLVSKHNLAADTPALRYAVRSHQIGLAISTSKIEWLGQSDHSAHELLAVVGPDIDEGALGEAEEFLVGALATGAQPAIEVIKAASAVGIAKRTLYRAKTALDVRSRKAQGEAHGSWVWELKVAMGTTTHNLGDLGDLDDLGAL